MTFRAMVLTCFYRKFHILWLIVRIFQKFPYAHLFGWGTLGKISARFPKKCELRWAMRCN
jgi:hypothetical protein